MINSTRSSNQVGDLSVRPLISQTTQDLFEGDLKKIYGGLRPPVPSIPLIPEPPFVPGICPPAPDLD